MADSSAKEACMYRLETEQNKFNKSLKFFLADGKQGQWVIIKKTNVLGFFNS
jgi:hypothetical protein